MRILLIEDDSGLGSAVRDQLEAEGHSPDWVQTLADAGDAARVVPYDLILLDLMLPDGSGLTLLRRLRAEGSATPVIILTARDRITERIDGLNAGADDYIVKPFDLAELSARIGAVARRYSGNPNPLISHGPLDIDLAALPLDLIQLHGEESPDRAAAIRARFTARRSALTCSASSASAARVMSCVCTRPRPRSRRRRRTRPRWPRRDRAPRRGR